MRNCLWRPARSGFSILRLLSIDQARSGRAAGTILISTEPNFFIVGAHKCGTTALFDFISQHPNAWCPLVKEPNFLATDFPFLSNARDEQAYLDLFAGADDTHIAVGEASPIYLLSHTAVDEIRRRYPAARLIIMIRNPVDMVYSFHSQMQITLNETELDFERAWRLQDDRLQGRHIPRRCKVPQFLQYREVGRLSKHAQKFFDRFPAEQIKIVLFDDLKNDPRAVYDDVCAFLSLPVFAGVNFRVVNANRKHRSKLLARLTDRPLPALLERPIRSIKGLFGISEPRLRPLLSRWNTLTAPRPKLRPEFRAELVEAFADEIDELERLTGRDLSHWRA